MFERYISFRFSAGLSNSKTKPIGNKLSVTSRFSEVDRDSMNLERKTESCPCSLPLYKHHTNLLLTSTSRRNFERRMVENGQDLGGF